MTNDLQQIQQQYIDAAHDSFVRNVQGLIAFLESLMLLPEATEDDKRVLNLFKVVLQGKEAQEIEKNLAEGVVRKSTFDKAEKFYKDLVDLALDSFPISPMTKVFLKQLAYVKIEQDKEMEMIRLRTLGMIEG